MIYLNAIKRLKLIIFQIRSINKQLFDYDPKDQFQMIYIIINHIYLYIINNLRIEKNAI